MATYSSSLRLTLLADGEQPGVWGQTQNANLGTLLEQAITGVVNITMANANYTLSNYNGASDQARNAVLVIGGTNGAVRKVIAPLVPKLYTIVNNTVGGYAITIGGSTGAFVTIPNGTTALVYCDGSAFYSGVSFIPGPATSLNTTNFTVAEVGGKLVFQYGGVTVASMDSAGVFTSASDIVGGGTP